MGASAPAAAEMSELVPVSRDVSFVDALLQPSARSEARAAALRADEDDVGPIAAVEPVADPMGGGGDEADDAPAPAPTAAAKDTGAPAMISEDEAVRIARQAIEGHVELSAGGGVDVALRDGAYTITFTRNDPPGTRGPDYDAQVTVDAKSGTVTSVLGGS